MFVFLNSTLQVLLNISTKQHFFLLTNISMDTVSSVNLLRLKKKCREYEVVFDIVWLHFWFFVLCKWMLLFDINVKNAPKLFWKKKSIFVRECMVYYLSLIQEIPLHAKKYHMLKNKIWMYRQLTEIVRTFYINDMDISLEPIHEFSFWMLGDTIFINPSVKCPIFLAPN